MEMCLAIWRQQEASGDQRLEQSERGAETYNMRSGREQRTKTLKIHTIDLRRDLEFIPAEMSSDSLPGLAAHWPGCLYFATLAFCPGIFGSPWKPEQSRKFTHGHFLMIGDLK